MNDQIQKELSAEKAKQETNDNNLPEQFKNMNQ